MAIEIDQSNKIERTDKDTYLAFSNAKALTFIVTAETKRQIVDYLVGKGKSRKNAHLMVFAACLFILLRNCFERCSSDESVTVDTEYTGHEATIKGVLARCAQKERLSLPLGRIFFARIGKRSNAHSLAWQAQRGKRAAERIITFRDLAALL